MTRRARALVAALALGVTAAGACGGGETEPAAAEPEATEEVVLEPVGSTGEDPFAESVAITETADFPDAVRTTIADTTDGLPEDDETGGRTAGGGTPGLYGGSRDEAVCDVPALTEFLSDPANRAQAEAFAGVLDITVAELEAGFLDALSPVVLVADAVVTNHGFRDGEAVPFTAVLQAGTAVLVDGAGVPRVRCSCGNPLARPPARVTLTATRGPAWATYRPVTVVTITPAPQIVTALTVIDITTGDTFQQPPGPPAPPPPPPPPPTTTAPPPPTTTAPAPTEPPPPEPGAASIEALLSARYGDVLLGRCEEVDGSAEGLCWVEVRRGGSEAVVGIGYPASEIVTYYLLDEGPGGWVIVESYDLSGELPDPNIPDWVDG